MDDYEIDQRIKLIEREYLDFLDDAVSIYFNTEYFINKRKINKNNRKK